MVLAAYAMFEINTRKKQSLLIMCISILKAKFPRQSRENSGWALEGQPQTELNVAGRIALGQRCFFAKG